MASLASVPSNTTNTTTSSTASTGSTTSAALDNTMIASNFTTFLQLLTTQLKNQNPLDPLDTNQFTQQLVQFAQVEQQMKSNSQLQTLVSLQQSAQSTAALAYIGKTVVLDGSTAKLTNSSATWNLNVSKPATATVTIQDSTGQTVYTGKISLSPGGQEFKWNGIGTNGKQCADGTYKLTATAVDASNQTVSVAAEIEGTVDSVDLTQSPPTITVAGETYTIDKVKRIVSK
jgi:flagellar basal-body rod modification protein FlgD